MFKNYYDLFVESTYSASFLFKILCIIQPKFSGFLKIINEEVRGKNMAKKNSLNFILINLRKFCLMFMYVT